MLEHLYIPRQGDREVLIAHNSKFQAYTPQQLIDYYNHIVDTGIVGARAQCLVLIALRWSFMKAFGHSPIKLESNVVVSISGKARLVNGKLEYDEAVY